MNEEERAAIWKDWLEERPPAVRAVAESHPFGCYRLSDDGGHGHYQIVAYTEPHDGSAVKIKLLHGRDSFTPGITVFGVPPDDLTPCGCGQWQEATDEQLEFMERTVESLEGLEGFEARSAAMLIQMRDCPK